MINSTSVYKALCLGLDVAGFAVNTWTSMNFEAPSGLDESSPYKKRSSIVASDL